MMNDTAAFTHMIEIIEDNVDDDEVKTSIFVNMLDYAKNMGVDIDWNKCFGSSECFDKILAEGMKEELDAAFGDDVDEDLKWSVDSIGDHEE